jgi:predicted RNase H-like nuclease (RuvC/YqgF family)
MKLGKNPEEDHVKETKGRSEGKAESHAEASLEEVLDVIEARVESLVEVVKGLSGENIRLKAELASAREASEKNGGAAASLKKHEADRATVRARVERLLKTLEEASAPPRPS